MNRTESVITAVALAAILGTGIVPGVPGVDVPRASAQEPGTETLADQVFRLDWTATPNGNGDTTIRGYIYNDYGEAADQVHLRITGFDASGAPIDSFIEPVDDTVPNFDRAYFDFHVPGHAASYKVAVDSFSFATAGE